MALFTDAAFDAAQAMDAVTHSITGTPLSPRAAADGLDQLMHVAARLTDSTRLLAERFRLTAHGGNETATGPVVESARAVVDYLREAATEATHTRSAIAEAHGEMKDLATVARGTGFTV